MVENVPRLELRPMTRRFAFIKFCRFDENTDQWSTTNVTERRQRRIQDFLNGVWVLNKARYSALFKIHLKTSKFSLEKRKFESLDHPVNPPLYKVLLGDVLVYFIQAKELVKGLSPSGNIFP